MDDKLQSIFTCFSGKKDELIPILQKVQEEFDMVALALAMVPSDGLEGMAKEMALPLGDDGFVQEKHPKLDPVNTLKTGIFSCGCALGPKDVRDTVSDALGAAAKAASFLRGDRVTASPEKAFIYPDLCDGCGACIQVCPSNAITLTDRKASVDPFLCSGCGGCIPECPKEAIDLRNSKKDQLIASLKGALMDKGRDEVRLIAFVEKSIGYTGVDFLGLDRTAYPESIRVIQVPSTALIGLKLILHAFALGADCVLMIEGDHNADELFTKKRIDRYKDELDDLDIDSFRLYYSLVQLPSYKNIANVFDMYTQAVKDLGPIEPEVIEDVKVKLGI